MRLHAVVTLVALLAAMTACTGGKAGSPAPYGTGDPELAAANPYGGPSDPFLTDGNAVLRALDTIGQRYSTPLRLTSISAHANGGLILDVQKPADKGHVERYIVSPDGKVLGPIPVKLVVNGGLATRRDIDVLLFDPKTIAFTRLDAAARDAIAHAKLGDARVYQWGLGGAKKKIYMIVESLTDHRIILLDRQLNIVGQMKQ